MFVSLQNQFDLMFRTGLQSQHGKMISFVMSVFIISCILWMTCQGLLAMAGKTEEPIKDTVFKIGSLIIIYAFATEPQWLNLIDAVVDGLKSSLSIGDSSALGALDALINSIEKEFGEVKSRISIRDLGHGFGLLFTFALESLSVIIIAVITAIPLIVNEFTLKFLLAISPLFIFCLSFQVIRGMFNAWMQLVISSVLYFVFLNLIIGNAIHFTDKLNLGTKESIVHGLNMLIASLFIAKIIGVLKEISSSLSSVTADSIASAIGTKAGNLAARGTIRGTMGAGKLAGKGAAWASREVDDNLLGGRGQKYIVNPLVKMFKDYFGKT
ncbi:MAG: hypothetical protein GKC53_05450 [Neisseriaceae bacterium]|nr:MAG: hypothetical protein GKC53_05450 [Neisseriaceae bacterium]